MPPLPPACRPGKEGEAEVTEHGSALRAQPHCCSADPAHAPETQDCHRE